MKAASAPLIALLGDRSRQFRIADLLTITLVAGAVTRYASRDIPIIYSGNTYVHNDVLFERSRIRLVVGLEVDQMDVTFYPKDTSMLGGFHFLEAVRRGVLDGARVSLNRAFLPDTGNVPTGALNMFSGRVSVISEASRTMAKVSVKSDLELLNIPLPRNTFQPRCVHTLYDEGCTINRNTAYSTGTVTSGVSDVYWNSTLSSPDNWFTLGYVEFQTGQNAGLRRGVRASSVAAGSVSIYEPLPYVPAAGDTFRIWPGCDKLQSTCANKFSNLPRFKGYPYIPVPETLL